MPQLSSSMKQHYPNQQETTVLNKMIKNDLKNIEIIPTKNPTGANNCFVNVIMQILFQAKEFRESIINYKQQQSKLFSSIRVIISQFYIYRTYLLNIKS